MKSGPEKRPGRVRLTTRPVEGSQPMPSHLQQSVVAFQVVRRPEGSEVMLDLTARRAMRSMGLQAEDERRTAEVQQRKRRTVTTRLEVAIGRSKRRGEEVCEG